MTDTHTEITEEAPRPELPEGRVTTKQMAEFVAERIDEAKDTLRAEQRSATRAVKSEIRWWLASFAAAYQFHVDLTFLAVAAGAWIGWTHVMPHVQAAMPAIKTYLKRR